MGKYQIKQVSNDAIVYRYEADQEQAQAFGGPWGDSSKFVHESVPQATIDAEADTEKWAKLRAQRGVKLIDVDKTRYTMVWADQSGGNPMSQADKDAWATYRQALLDVPGNVADISALDLGSMTWPTKP